MNTRHNKPLRLFQIGVSDMSTNDICNIRRMGLSRDDGTMAVGIDYYAKNHRNKPITDARWAVAKFVWEHSRWRRIRKLSGPMTLDEAIQQLYFVKARTGLPIIGES